MAAVSMFSASRERDSSRTEQQVAGRKKRRKVCELASCQILECSGSPAHKAIPRENPDTKPKVAVTTLPTSPELDVQVAVNSGGGKTTKPQTGKER